MKNTNINDTIEESAFFIAKLNSETLWDTDSSTIKACIACAKKRLNMTKDSKWPQGTTVEIVRVVVQQSLAKQIQ